MKQEDIQLLLVDLCGRLPYGVKVTFAGYSGRDDCILNYQHLNGTYAIEYLRLRPYLRPMSSVTGKEREEYHELCDCYCGIFFDSVESIDWLNKNMFDYRGLIPKGLAIEVTEQNNPYKNNLNMKNYTDIEQSKELVKIIPV